MVLELLELFRAVLKIFLQGNFVTGRIVIFANHGMKVQVNPQCLLDSLLRPPTICLKIIIIDNRYFRGIREKGAVLTQTV
jgi:DNA-directed RNA polymerase subunit E'/Rpb7